MSARVLLGKTVHILQQVSLGNPVCHANSCSHASHCSFHPSFDKEAAHSFEAEQIIDRHLGMNLGGIFCLSFSISRKDTAVKGELAMRFDPE